MLLLAGQPRASIAHARSHPPPIHRTPPTENHPRGNASVRRARPPDLLFRIQVQPFDGNQRRPVAGRCSAVRAGKRVFALSAAEEQPQQNDHRYRHAHQPEQNPSSHVCLLEFLRWIQERQAVRGVPATGREKYPACDRASRRRCLTKDGSGVSTIRFPCGPVASSSRSRMLEAIAGSRINPLRRHQA
jgi:hypothetical protein